MVIKKHLGKHTHAGKLGVKVNGFVITGQQCSAVAYLCTGQEAQTHTHMDKLQQYPVQKFPAQLNHWTDTYCQWFTPRFLTYTKPSS